MDGLGSGGAAGGSCLGAGVGCTGFGSGAETFSGIGLSTGFDSGTEAFSGADLDMPRAVVAGMGLYLLTDTDLTSVRLQVSNDR